jgi:hypothetical protein
MYINDKKVHALNAIKTVLCIMEIIYNAFEFIRICVGYLRYPAIAINGIE